MWGCGECILADGGGIVMCVPCIVGTVAGSLTCCAVYCGEYVEYDGAGEMGREEREIPWMEGNRGEESGG